MRKYAVTSNGLNYFIEIPDSVVFAFNPLYIVINTDPVNITMSMNVVCNGVTRSVKIEVFNGKAKVYFSRILQLFFDDYKHFRTLSFTVALTRNGVNVFSTSFMAIWGSLPLGGRYNAYGLFNFNGKSEYERTRVWFKKFPFKVTMFSVGLKPTIKCLSDGAPTSYASLPALPTGFPGDADGEWVDTAGNIYQYDASSREYFIEDVGNCLEQGIFDVNPAIVFPNAKRSASLRIGERGTVNVFDDTFDYTFYQQGLSTHIVNLKISNETAGYYLRWIDRVGELQYFLFTNKIVTTKNALASDSIVDMEKIGPMWYADHVRRNQVSSVITCKCSAVALPLEIYSYVASIVTAPIIDLYLGKSASGREIWVPVNIVSASHDFDTTKPLNDLTISFTLPECNSQTL
ncbi:MAG: hypothetical protein NC453_22725 [Muribaculum sp.]|nr:hypothetical protein [Muribaculum sp.]